MNPEEKSVFVFDGEISIEAAKSLTSFIKEEMNRGEDHLRKLDKLFPGISLKILNKPKPSEKPQTS